jgi:hypothetical protein
MNPGDEVPAEDNDVASNGAAIVSSTSNVRG